MLTSPFRRPAQAKSPTRRNFLKGGMGIAAAATYARVAGNPAAAASATPSVETATGVTTALRSLFTMPPKEWAPRVWWHWMSPNITEEGILKDLDWYQKVGIGGFQQFTGDGNRSVYVDKPVVYMSNEFKSAFRTAIQGASERDLEATLSSSAGWSITGAPFVRAEDGMKKHVWTETWVDGGAPLDVRLPAPPNAIGTFLDSAITQKSLTPAAPLYRDQRVFAYRVADGTASPDTLRQPQVRVSAWSATPTGPVQSNGDAGVPLPEAEVSRLGNESVIDPVQLRNAAPWVRFEYPAPVTIGGISIAAGTRNATTGAYAGTTFPGWVLEAERGNLVEVSSSQDGNTWTVMGSVIYTGVQRTLTLSTTTARYFRVRWTAGSDIAVTKLALRSLPTIHKWEHKAGFGSVHNFYDIDTPAGGLPGVAKSSVVDLTPAMLPDGTLTWTPPPGRWVVVRLGYSLTGHENSPTTAAATGLEVDKLDPTRVRAYVNTYLDEFQSALPDELWGSTGLSGLLCDSIEAGYQTWTDAIVDEFIERRGYDPSPWLPTLVGTVVESASASDKFLWDWRTTLGDMIAEHHYGVIADVVHERGLQRFYSEAQEDARGWFGDDTAIRRHADIPMGASRTVTDPLGGVLKEQFRLDCKGASSIAHVYGKEYSACETATLTRGNWVARDLKPHIDQVLVAGITRLIIHSSDHQPLDKGPGTTLGGIGWYMNRNQTWADQAKPFVEWMGRTSGLLNEGVNVADIAYFYGQEAPVAGQWIDPKQPDVPRGSQWDFVDSEIILNELSVRNGKLVTQSGQSYSLLYLGGMSSRMTLDVLRKLKYFVQAGATICGRKPTQSPSLADLDRTFQQVASDLWGNGDETVRTVGRGKVLTGLLPDAALATIGMEPDWSFSDDVPLTLVHRRTDDLDIYFVVNNDHYAPVSTTLTLRAAASRVELWDAVDAHAWLSSFESTDDQTTMPLTLGAAESLMVVLHRGAPASATLPQVTEQALPTSVTSWSLTFSPPRGTPDQLTMDTLTPLSDSTVTDVRYYAGTTVYTSVLDVTSLPATQDGRVLLDLGEVNEFAEVTLNGTRIGQVLWRAPYRVDVTPHVRQGANSLEIRVTNVWWNRIVGDLQPGATQYTTRYNNETFGASAGAALLRSGLVGPVSLVHERGRTSTDPAAATPTPPAPGTLRATTAPRVAGPPVVDQTLTATAGTWSAPASFTFQWTRNAAPISGATAATYRPVPADVDSILAVIATASASGLDPVSASSDGVVVRRGTFKAVRPTTTGQVRVGAKTRAKTRTGRWSPAPDAVTYQWRLDGEPIRGAHRRSYRIRPSDAGHRLNVSVTARRNGYFSETKSSRPVEVPRVGERPRRDS